MYKKAIVYFVLTTALIGCTNHSNSGMQQMNLTQDNTHIDNDLTSEQAEFLDSTVIEVKYEDIFNPDGSLKYH